MAVVLLLTAESAAGRLLPHVDPGGAGRSLLSAEGLLVTVSPRRIFNKDGVYVSQTTYTKQKESAAATTTQATQAPVRRVRVVRRAASATQAAPQVVPNSQLTSTTGPPSDTALVYYPRDPAPRPAQTFAPGAAYISGGPLPDITPIPTGAGGPAPAQGAAAGGQGKSAPKESAQLAAGGSSEIIYYYDDEDIKPASAGGRATPMRSAP